MDIMREITFLPANSGNIGGVRTAEEIKYLVYHYTANDGATAEQNARYYHNTISKTSAHYFVDPKGVWQSVGDLRIAWAVGGKRYSDYKETGGASLYGVCKNANSISIELCDVERDGIHAAAPETIEKALALGRVLMARYGIPVERVVRHFDVTGKKCPAYYVDEARWQAFKERLVSPEAPPVVTCKAELPVLKKGCTGEAVRALQHVLNLRGADLDVDGSFGPATALALRNYQATHGLQTDECCGPASWASLIGSV